jgi:hypothetical protein
VLPTWTENGTIVRPGTFPRRAREPTFTERDEATLKKRSPYQIIVTPESGMLDKREILRVVSAYRARMERRERRALFARVVVAIVLGAACGISAAIAAPGHASRSETVRAPSPEKVLVRSVERRVRHAPGI